MLFYHSQVVRGAIIVVAFAACTLTALILYVGNDPYNFLWSVSGIAASDGPVSASPASHIDFNSFYGPVSDGYIDSNASDGAVSASLVVNFNASDAPVSASLVDFNASHIRVSASLVVDFKASDAPVSASLVDFNASDGPVSASLVVDFNASGGPIPSPVAPKKQSLESVLKDAADGNNTVILSTINEDWAAPGSLLDLFIGSFRNGDGTKKLLKHLVLVALDHKAYVRCREVHRNCYALFTEGTDFHHEVKFLSPIYLEMVWQRTNLLLAVLEMGYNFVFTDADILWLRNPFPRFYEDADFQIACDRYLGNPYSLRNLPNCGLQFVRSNNRSIEFFKFWYVSRLTYPGQLEQPVLNKIKFDPFISEIGVKIRFLHPDYFGGICSPSRDFNRVCTMHTNCCVGKSKKIGDLKLMLEDWGRYKSSSPSIRKRNGREFHWSAHYCRGRKKVSPKGRGKKKIQRCWRKRLRQ